MGTSNNRALMYAKGKGFRVERSPDKLLLTLFRYLPIGGSYRQSYLGYHLLEALCKNPHFGMLEIEDGGKIFFKIDYYAPDLRHGSEDPTDPEHTVRVLTIMLAHEY